MRWPVSPYLLSRQSPASPGPHITQWWTCHVTWLAHVTSHCVSVLTHYTCHNININPPRSTGLSLSPWSLMTEVPVSTNNLHQLKCIQFLPFLAYFSCWYNLLRRNMNKISEVLIRLIFSWGRFLDCDTLITYQNGDSMSGSYCQPAAAGCKLSANFSIINQLLFEAAILLTSAGEWTVFISKSVIKSDWRQSCPSCSCRHKETFQLNNSD